ncbi:hypothetical protein [Providencia rustigianii]|uniref:hypothetical protein n=1 Tax=Providencia rustigianii TaxID=158850 RepID=UPI00224349BA|nr:hypothetical protein [Providencia rustigianii]
MVNNTDIVRYYNGKATIENFFGEELKYIYVLHYVSGLTHKGSERRLIDEKFFSNLPNKSISENIFSFKYELGLPNSFDYWFIKLETISGKTYATKKNFYCSIKEEDRGKVILGVNGEAKTLYVAFSSSSGCSTKLIEES